MAASVGSIWLEELGDESDELVPDGTLVEVGVFEDVEDGPTCWIKY